MTRFPEVAKVLAGITDPGRATEVLMAAVRSDMAAAFASTYWVAGGLCLLTLVVSLFLPRKHEQSHLLEGDDESARMHVPVH